MLMIYVWRGQNVLKNYGTGLAVVPATSAEQAWATLKADDIRAYYALRHGIDYIFDERGEELYSDDCDPAWQAIAPEEFTPDALPTLVMWGSE